METLKAIALTWDSTTVRVRCPYMCPKGIHTHGFTRPRSRKRNTRAPHCVPEKDDDGRHVFPEDYRILFPFEEDPETDGMWWELDHRKKRWRTVSWKVYDPEYWESCEDTKQPSDRDVRETLDSRILKDDETDIAEALSVLAVDNTNVQTKHGAQYGSGDSIAGNDAHGSTKRSIELSFNAAQTRDGLSLLFDSFCVSNSLDDARDLLAKTSDPSRFVNGEGSWDGKPLLLAVVEEGHEGVVKFLLNHGAELESKDWDGNTALLRALCFGRGNLAERLVNAGADINVSNNNGETVCDIARTSLERQKEAIRSENAMLYPREPPLIPFRFNKDRVLESIDTRRNEVSALQRIIKSYEQRQVKEQFLVRLHRVSQMYGEEQAQAVKRHGELDDQALLVRLLARVMKTPRDTEWRTVACLARGTVYPWIFAVSGYTRSLLDGILDRSMWKERVFDLADVVGHNLRADWRDGMERKGSFLACHSEKQLLAYFVWNHTTEFYPNDRESLLRSEAQQLSKLHAEIYFAQPGQGKAELCDDCYNFCERNVFHFGFRLTLRGVVKGETTWMKEFSPT